MTRVPAVAPSSRNRARFDPVSGPYRLIVASIHAAIAGFRHQRAHQRSLLDLADLEDWQLEDIGLTRPDVEAMLAQNGISRDPVSHYLDSR